MEAVPAIYPRFRQLALAIIAIALTAGVGLATLGRNTPAFAAVAAVTAVDQSVPEGSSSPMHLGTFTGAGPVSNYTATVTWGDGSPNSTVSVSDAGGGTFDVFGIHAYVDEGPNTFSFSIHDSSDNSDTASNNATATASENDTLTFTGSTLTPSATENTALSSVTVAHFSTTYTTNVAADFSALINWGDGNPATVGTITAGASPGQFNVSGSQTFAYVDEGSYSITVLVSDDAPGTAQTNGGAYFHTATATAAEADSLTGTGDNTTPVEGTAFSGQVAHFSNTYSGNVAADFTASINWGDGNTDTGITPGGGAGSDLTVSGTHTYADDGIFTVTTTLSEDAQGTATASTTSTATVSDADSIVVTVNNQTPTEGTALSGVAIATFTDTFAGSTAGDFAADINWGDGTTDTGVTTITGAMGGPFTVHGTHTYLDEFNPATVTVTIHDGVSASDPADPFQATTWSNTGTATVGEGDSGTLFPSTFSATEGLMLSNVVVETFVDNFDNTASDFTAVINWGDGGPTSAGTVTRTSANHFSISGSHTYLEQCVCTTNITFTDDSPSTLVVGPTAGTANVADAALTVTDAPQHLTGVENIQGISNVTVAHFTDADPNGISTGGGADYVAQINWGDGTFDFGTITANGGGGWDVTGSHVYQEEGGFFVRALICDTDNGGVGWVLPQSCPGPAGQHSSGMTSATAILVDIADATITGSPRTISSVEGGPAFNGIVASISDADQFRDGGTLADYSATIDWGDSTTTTGTIANCVPADNCAVPTYVGRVGTLANSCSSGTCDLVTSAAVTAGDAIIITVQEDTDGTGPMTATDGFGNTYNTDTFVHNGENDGLAVISAMNAHAIPSGGHITIHFTGNPSPAGVIADEFRGIGALDAAASAQNGYTGGSTTVDSGNITATQGDLVYGALMNRGGGSITWVLNTPAGATVLPGNNSGGDQVVPNWSIQGATGMTHESGTAPTSQYNFAAIAAYTPAGTNLMKVSGTHTYTEEGTYHPIVHFHDSGSAFVDVVSTANVADAALHATGGSTVNAVEGAAFSNQLVGTFTDDDPLQGETGADYTAVIDWGDSTPTSAGVVSLQSGSTYQVVGSHTYAEQGPYTITFTAHDTVSMASATTAASVADATLYNAVPSGYSGTEGAVLGPIRLTTFQDHDPNSGETGADYSAVIDWGDGGPTSAGSISLQVGSTWQVMGTHTYAEQGSYSPTITITDDGGTPALVTMTTINIADAALTAANRAAFSTSEDVALGGSTIVATFQDADLGHDAGSLADYSATINWGDGTTNSGTIASCLGGDACVGGTAAFKVTGGHTYTEGSVNNPSLPPLATAYPISVTINDDGGSSASASTSAAVSDYAINANNQSVSAVEGSAFNGAVATFTDTDPSAGSEGASHFQATINWGDSTSSTGTINGAGQNYTVNGNHTYAEEGSNLPVTVTITDFGGAVAVANSTVNVLDAQLTGTARAINAVEGQLFTGIAATFTDADPMRTVTDYTAIITWGDGHSSSGVISQCVVADACTGGISAFKVIGSNTFSEEGVQTGGGGITTVHIGDLGGAFADTSITPTVTDAALTITGVAQSVNEGAQLSGIVASFLDADPGHGENLADYAATINWGDSTTSAGAISPCVLADSCTGGTSAFKIVGTHTYAEEHPSGVTITVNLADDGGSTATASPLITVPDAPLSVGVGSLTSATEGASASGVVAHFTDADPAGTTGDYTATINWGDSTTSPGTVSANGGGWDVSGTHTYAEQGSFTYSVTVHDAGGAVASVNFVGITVADAALHATPTAATLPAIEGSPINHQLATFTDDNPGATLGDFSASINWGDSTPVSAGVVSLLSGSTYQVFGTHTYAEENASRSVLVTISDSATSTTASLIFNVADAALTLTSSVSGTQLGTEGLAYNRVIAHIVDADPAGTASDYSVNVNWGDGSGGMSVTAVPSGNGFDIPGVHTWAEETTGNIVVTVADNGSPSVQQTVSIPVNIADAALTVTPAGPFSVQASPQTWTGTLATFTDADPLGSTSPQDYTVSITNWGDGSPTSTGTAAGVAQPFSANATHSFTAPGVYAVQYTVTDAGGAVATGVTQFNVAFPPGPYHQLPPTRITDTRPGSGSPNAGMTLGSNSILCVQVAGVGGVPASGVQAAVFTVTATNETTDNFITAYPRPAVVDTAHVPTASNLNYRAHRDIANLVEVPLGVNGQDCFFNSGGSTDLVVDVEGYVSQQLNGTAGLYNPLSPTRIYDTRNNTPYPGSGHPLVHGLVDRVVQITGQGGVPSSHVGAVVLNVTITNYTNPGGVGFVTAYPGNQLSAPNASNVNFLPGDTISDRVIIPVDPTTGTIKLFLSGGQADAIVDVNGWFTDGTDAGATGSKYLALPPTRACDTRDSHTVYPGCPTAVIGPNGSVTLTLAGHYGIPALSGPQAPVAVVLNVTAVDMTGFGWLNVFPQGQAAPAASDLNWTGPEIWSRAGLSVVKLNATNGQVTILNPSSSTLDLVVDVEGWYS